MTTETDALDPFDDTPETEWRAASTARGREKDARSSHEYRMLRRNFLFQCQTHRNADGSYGQVCWLCHRPIDYRRNYRSPLAPTVDHVIPVRLAPDRVLTESNWRPAHRHCNESRERRRDDEMASLDTSEEW
jgi:5-methylcytosine-specific restriction endonuclease McrA